MVQEGSGTSADARRGAAENIVLAAGTQVLSLRRGAPQFRIFLRQVALASGALARPL